MKEGSALTPSSPPLFDYWLFATTWSPQLCCTRPKLCPTIHSNTFQTHGLWPTYYGSRNNKDYPTYCNTKEKNTNLDKRKNYQWRKHGSCSGLTSSEFFTLESIVADSPTMRRLHRHIEAVVDTHYASQQRIDVVLSKENPIISVRAVQGLLGGADKVAIKSSQYCVLEEITTCWARNDASASASTTNIGQQLSCPSLLQSDRNNAVHKYSCRHLVLDTHTAAESDMSIENKASCSFVSKALLRELKRNQQRV